MTVEEFWATLARIRHLFVSGDRFVRVIRTADACYCPVIAVYRESGGSRWLTNWEAIEAGLELGLERRFVEAVVEAADDYQLRPEAQAARVKLEEVLGLGLAKRREPAVARESEGVSA